MTVYEFDIELGELFIVKTYPDEAMGMSSLRPSDFLTLSSQIKTNATAAQEFIK